MDPETEWVIPLAAAANCSSRLIGGKAVKLARLAQEGFEVPPGFSITSEAYAHFVRENDLFDVIRMELGRKSFEHMRWEEIWDAALRIRSAFHAAPVPVLLKEQIFAGVETLDSTLPVAVRSSALSEDTAERSFAGLHESVVGVVGAQALLNAVRTVWASLWSDAALLYRQELDLDPLESRMAVLVQEVMTRDCSGVAFGRDPRNAAKDNVIVEAVPGPCSDLVDGVVDPDHWVLSLATGDVLTWRPGERPNDQDTKPLLAPHDLQALYATLQRIEGLFDWSPDIEWTGRADEFVLLQARPISTAQPDPDETRSWYLTLRPSMKRLQALRDRVVYERIPRLEALGQRFADEDLRTYDDAQLVEAIIERRDAVETWKHIYWDEFIPFAHGVRQLGTYYNDAVQPEDPYEFVGLLQGEEMLAAQRNAALARLAHQVSQNGPLAQAIRELLSPNASSQAEITPRTLASLRTHPGGVEFMMAFNSFMEQHMDVAYAGQRLADQPRAVLHLLLRMAQAPDIMTRQTPSEALSERQRLERRLFEAVGKARQAEAQEVLATARVSWRLRDDDNILVGRLDSQLFHALDLALERLRVAGRIKGTGEISVATAPIIAQALQDPSGGEVVLPEPEASKESEVSPVGNETPRQLVGQPAAPGVATGKVRRIRGAADLGQFSPGEILVCDAIQPTMTHLVPLASAVVERRGGMLIHGAIIARELGIPCVNGVADVVDLLQDGEIVTVDGHLGIVTVGRPEFVLEGVPWKARR
jgi:pyruvate,water dikinase